MSLKWMLYALSPEGPSNRDLQHALYVLGSFVYPKEANTACISRLAFARRGRMSESTAERRIASLKASGYISVIPGNGSGNASVITFYEVSSKKEVIIDSLPQFKKEVAVDFLSEGKGSQLSKKRESTATKKGVTAVTPLRVLKVDTKEKTETKTENAQRSRDEAQLRRDAARPKRTRSQADKDNRARWYRERLEKRYQEMRREAEARVGSSSHYSPEQIEEWKKQQETGFEEKRIQRHLASAADRLEKSAIAREACEAAAGRLRAMDPAGDHAALERTLTALEEELFAELKAAAPEELLAGLRANAADELKPYRSRMGAAQLRQVAYQFIQKQVLAHYNLPRLSLFYMGGQI
jgi:hypothetical protein